MAKSTTKFSRGSGETTSGTIAVLDLSTLEDELFPELNTPTEGSNFSKFVSGFKEGFVGNFSSTRIIRSFAENALPTGFSRLLGSYDELTNDLKEIKQSVEKTNVRDLLYLSKKVNTLLPRLKDNIPTSVYEGISGTLKDSIENYEYESKEQLTSIRKKSKRFIEEEAAKER